MRLRIGTRKSAMALAQTEEIARRLTKAAPDLDVEIVKFETSGDVDQTSKLLKHGGKGGAFVAEIRDAVRKGQLHAAMHSLKDIPGNEDTPGLVIGATLARDAPGDVLVLRPGLSLEEFRKARGKGFKIGTNAVRRCVSRGPRASGSRAFSARGASASVKLPHSMHFTATTGVGSGTGRAVTAALGGALGGAGAAAGAGSSPGATIFSFSGSICRASGAGSAPASGGET